MFAASLDMFCALLAATSRCRSDHRSEQENNENTTSNYMKINTIIVHILLNHYRLPKESFFYLSIEENYQHTQQLFSRDPKHDIITCSRGFTAQSVQRP